MMDGMRGKIYTFLMNKENDKESDYGAVLLVEATIVFPIVFFVIFFIICVGNSYFVQSHIQSVADRNALLAADYARSEYLMDFTNNGGTVRGNTINNDLNPYQIHASDKLKKASNDKVSNELNNGVYTIFTAMKPSSFSSGSQPNYVVIENGFFESYVNVEIKYKLKLIPLLDVFNVASIDVSAQSTARINGNREFIRNADMLKDLFTDFMQTSKGQKLAGQVKKKIDELTEGLKKFLKIFK